MHVYKVFQGICGRLVLTPLLSEQQVPAELCAPLKLHGLDVEAQSGADSGDVFAVDSSHDGGLACIVQAPASNRQQLSQQLQG